MLDLSDKAPAIEQACRALDVRTLDLFGSVVHGADRPDSDVDALVSFHGAHDLFNRYMGLREQLGVIFGRRVDLVMSDAIRNDIFRAHVMAEKVRVYAA